ncbi:MAG: AAC(3) family N-acetyltransferase [Oscillospiraceae bacterium]
MNYKEQLYNDLKTLGIKSGDTILVHTSIKGLNVDNITPNDIIDTLLLAIGNEGTLLVPSLSYASVTIDTPQFDLLNTKSCIGMLPEVFRTEYATHRSIHPTHSVCAIGNLALLLTQSHQIDNTPVGENSPFQLLPTVNGKILMLGSGLLPNTFMHGVEEAANADYPLAKQTVEYTITDNVGNTYKKAYYPHSFGTLVQRYDRLADKLQFPYLVSGNVLNGKAFLIDAKEAMKQGIMAIHNENHYFVD